MIKTTKTLDQFMADFFRDEDTVEINAKFLQETLRNLIQNDRLAQAQLRDYKMRYERAMFKVEMMSADRIIESMESNIVYKIDERV